MDLKLEVVVVPVSDVDRAKQFYVEALGFRMDVDHSSATYEGGLGFRYRGAPSYRIVQLTPPGSACSIQIGLGITEATPGSAQGLVPGHAGPRGGSSPAGGAWRRRERALPFRT